MSCLESLLHQSYDSYEIILVDNGSKDGSLEMIENKLGHLIRILKNKNNLGFAEGVNTGIRAAKGEFIALLNNDAVADKNWLKELVRGIEKSETVGMCASKIYLNHLEKAFDNTGQLITRDGLGRGRARLEKDVGQYDREESVLCPSGCAALYRKRMLDDMKLFDKQFFIYAEDIDVGLQGRLMGYDCLYIPTALVHHKFSSSTGYVSPLKAFYVERNRLWVVIKCFPLSHLIASPIYTFLRYLYNFSGVLRRQGPASQYVKQGSFSSLVYVLLKVYLSTLIHLPYLIIHRMRINRKRSITTKEFGTLLKRYGLPVRDAALNEL